MDVKGLKRMRGGGAYSAWWGRRRAYGASVERGRENATTAHAWTE